MVLPKHPHRVILQRGPLFKGGDPAETLWENPQMRGVDKVNPTSTVGRVFIRYTVLKK
jgi:hypothetical protein